MANLAKAAIKNWALAFCFFTMAVMLYMTITNNISSGILPNFAASMAIALFPSIIFSASLYYAVKHKHGQNMMQAVWKFPLILLALLAFLLAAAAISNHEACSGEGCIGAFFLLAFGIPSIICFSAVFSLLPAIFIKRAGRQARRAAALLAMAMSVILAILIISISITCMFGYDTKCISSKAFASGDCSIFSSASNALERDKCYLQVARQTLDVKICDLVSSRDECIMEINSMIILSSRQDMPELQQGE